MKAFIRALLGAVAVMTAAVLVFFFTISCEDYLVPVYIVYILHGCNGGGSLRVCIYVCVCAHVRVTTAPRSVVVYSFPDGRDREDSVPSHTPHSHIASTLTTTQLHLRSLETPITKSLSTSSQTAPPVSSSPYSHTTTTRISMITSAPTLPSTPGQSECSNYIPAGGVPC